MALLRKINTKAKAEINTGFGTNTSDYGGRFVNKNGMPNIEKSGIGYFERISWYHSLLQMSRWKFLFLIFAFFILANLMFAILYLIIGVEHLNGLNAHNSWEQFAEAFFFSAQTFTTVGYGRINPTNVVSSAAASFEALFGLLSFALATGLFYARFSKPKAFLRFSENAVLAPFKDGVAIMMRMASYKNNNLTEAQANLTAGLILEENGKPVNKFFQLDLEYSRVNALSLSWTVVHPINSESPFYKFSADDFAGTRGELILYVKAFDDMFSNSVVARTSYTFSELVIGAKFIPMYHRDELNSSTKLDLGKLNSHVPADISFAFAGEKNNDMAS